ncbi:hypothetical protein [Actinomadura sp. K4S16]|uniref:hypothetical protein n=1 Tax=Actinomadura sp. K4S16 TaxID=1316147 RepID=UPI0011EDA97E|nr:hypothetical protein [Actinomadura sp. K4S16]
MSGRLVGDVIEWLQTPAAAGVGDNEALVLITIADRVLSEETREMRRFKGDQCSLHQRICRVLGVTPKGLRPVLQKLARRGLEVRVEIGRDRLGRPIYARRGHAMGFRLPELPASVRLPEREDEAEQEDGPGGLAACG